MSPPPPKPCFSANRRNTKNHTPRKRAVGTIQDRSVLRKLLSTSPANFT